MDTLTPEQLLNMLPAILYGWSLVTLVWGALAIFLMFGVSKRTQSCIHRSSMRQNDQYALGLATIANVFLIWYLFFYRSADVCTGWIVVINVFYMAHLTYLSVGISRWWASVKKRCTKVQLITH